MKKTVKYDTAKALADKIIEMLDKGVSPWHKSWNCEQFPRSVNGREYRGLNAIILGMRCFENPYWVTFKKCKELGGNVRKGEKGTPIMYWQSKIVESRDADGNVEIGKDGKVIMKKVMLIRGYTVFNVTQCDGLPEKFFPKPDKNKKKVKPHKAAEKMWRGYKDKPAIQKSTCCAYSPSSDKITMPPPASFESMEEYYAALFHEGCHSTGHKSRLDRKFGGSFGTEPYAKEELIAELGAQLLCQHCGITRTLENGAAYCKGWSKAIKSMPNYGKALICAAAQAQKAVDWIMGVKFDKGDEE